MHLNMRVEEGRAMVDFAPGEIYQGFPGMMHGGILATILDEVMAWAVYAAGSWAVTAKMEIRYRDVGPLNGTLHAVGGVTRDRGGRTFEAEGRITADDGSIVAEATGLFMRVPVERMRELERFARAYAADKASTAEGP
jgi:acyl-coenzyme A thioesterase PaaI-like protein